MEPKDCPPHTGESLELSAIPGLESRDVGGATLPELIGIHGAALTGSAVKEPFPLLIKLINARQQLSVQVHPDDAYAMAHHQKLGKNEAWAIIDALPGARLVLGLQDSVSLEDLWTAALQGQAIEGLLRSVPVRPGEVYNIPAGTIHAIGGGITLYEVQQTSDLTYRLYDWGRLDSSGQGREPHLEHSLAVARLGQRPLSALPELLQQDGTGTLERMVGTPYFALDRLSLCHGLVIQPDPARFRALTALSPLRLHWGDDSLTMRTAQTALLPADGFEIRIEGELALLAAPGLSDAASN